MIKLFIARIPYSLSSKVLKDLFTPFGVVNRAYVSVNLISQESLGCGYVEMEDVSDGQTAIKQLNGSYLGGKVIGVSVAFLKNIGFRSYKI